MPFQADTRRPPRLLPVPCPGGALSMRLCAVALTLASAARLNAESLTLAADGVTAYRIVIPGRTDVSTRAVAADFAGILNEITGAPFPIVTDDTEAVATEIVLGADNARLARLQLADMGQAFAEGEYEIRTVDRKLIIAGGPNRGTINGMYGFLQDHLGCRWFTPACMKIPRRSVLTLARTRDRQKPAFRWRSTSPPMHWDASWTVRNRLNECKTWGGSRSMMLLMSDPRATTLGNYYSAHALSYVPASLYADHPEYYALASGARVCDENSNARAYCVTNPGFIQYMADRLKRSAAGYQGRPARLGLGHTDSANHCQCRVCKAAYDRIGLAGTYMAFNNRVAEVVCRAYPNITIGTLAYGMTFAPTAVKMHPNVFVTWCPISLDYLHGLDQGGPNQDRDYIGQLRRWIENTSQLGVWYYHYQADSLMPHPRLHASKHNFALFQKMGLDGVFVETGGNAIHDNDAPDGDKQMRAYGDPKYGYFTFPWSLTHIKSYIACRLMWDPGYDVERGIREFCAGYYGAAGAELARYVLMVEAKASYARTIGTTFKAYPGVHLSASFSPMLKWPAVEEMDTLFDAAERKVAGDATLLRRVRMARLTVQLAILCFAAPDAPLRQKAFAGFFPLLEELGIATLPRTGITYEKVTVEQFKNLVSDPARITIPGQERVGANLLVNSSFETEIDGDGIPDGWQADGTYLPEDYTVDPGGVALDESRAHSGRRCVRLAKAPASKSIVSLRQRFDAEPGRSYRAKVRYQADVTTGAALMIFTAFGHNGEWLHHQGGARGIRKTGEQWMELSVDTRCDEDTAQLMIEFFFYDDASEGVAWIDDFECARIHTSN